MVEFLPSKIQQLTESTSVALIQPNSPGFPHLEARERLANKAQVGEEGEDSGETEVSKPLVNTSR